MYRNKGIDETMQLENLTADDFPTFQNLYEELLNQEKIAQSEIVKTQIQKALMYVRKFVDGGRYAQVWNGPSTLVADTDFTVFNFQTLFANKNQIVANAQMLLVFKFLEQEIINRREKNMATGVTKHTIIIADEAHLFIDPKFPIALDFFYQMTKRIRKYGGSFMPITQSISDWNANEELAHKTTAILKESQYNFILKLKPSGVQNLADLYSSGNGINESEQRSIVEAKTGSIFLIGSESFHTFFDLEPSEYVRYLFERKDLKENIFNNVLSKLKKNDCDYSIDIQNMYLDKLRNLQDKYRDVAVGERTDEAIEEDEFWGIETDDTENTLPILLDDEGDDNIKIEKKKFNLSKMFGSLLHKKRHKKETHKDDTEDIDDNSEQNGSNDELSVDSSDTYENQTDSRALVVVDKVTTSDLSNPRKTNKVLKFFKSIAGWFRKKFSSLKRTKNKSYGSTPIGVESSNESINKEEKAQ